MEDLQFLNFLPYLIGGGLLVAILGIASSVYTTRLRIRHGYPLEGTWGQKHYAKTDQESVERIKLLSQENAQLRAELGSIKDRLVSIEKIVVEDSHKLSADIEALRSPAN
jgi:hypothetical protein